MNERTFVLCTAVWGEEYSRIFSDVCLRSLLASGNLPVLAGSGSKYIMHVDDAAHSHLQESKEIEEVARHLSIQFIIIPDELKQKYRNKFELMSLCHKEAIGIADSERLPIIFMSPDVVCSNNMVERLVELRCAGKRAVMVAGLRLAKESAVPALGTHVNDGILSLKPRDLVGISFQHQHPWMQAMNWDSDEFFSIDPTHLYFGDAKQALIARCWHLHPLMVHPQERDCSFESTIDDDYVAAACTDLEGIHVVTDSDEMVLFELSPTERNSQYLKPEKATPEIAAKPMLGRLEEINYQCFAKDIIFRVADGDFSALRARAEGLATAVVGAVKTLENAQHESNEAY